jgi:glycosyltransferase involved in cell wall biosynthesis
MKIKFLLPKLVNGGGEIVTVSLINELRLELKKAEIKLYTEQNINFSEKTDIDGDLKFQNKLLFLRNIFMLLYRRHNIETIFVSVLSGMNILAGIINLIFNRKLIMYEHSDLSKFYFCKVPGVKLNISRILLYNVALFSTSKIIFVSDLACRNSSKYFLRFYHKKFCVISNPVCPLSNRINHCAISDTYDFIIVGRWSAEKRIGDGLRFLDSLETYYKVLVVTDVADSKEITDLRNLAINTVPSYGNVPALNFQKTVLLNFSQSESFSMVIGEWLTSGGLVMSTTAESNTLWEQYRGFFDFKETKKSFNKSLALTKQSDRRELYSGKSTREHMNEFLSVIRY